MKKLMTMLLTLLTVATMTIQALAADYSFSSGGDTMSGFGGSTSIDTPVTPDPMNENTRRDKNAALLPPPYGVFSGDIPTDPSSPYHNNLPTSGFVPVNQELPPVGNENYAPGGSLLPSTSQTSALNTTPWYWRYHQGI